MLGLRGRVNPGDGVAQGVDEHRCSELGQPLEHLPGGGAIERHLEAPVHRARVEGAHDLEGGDPGGLVPGQDRALHRSGSPPARQEGEVQVDPPGGHGIDELLGQQHPVGDDRGDVDPGGTHLVDELGIGPLGLPDRDAQGLGEFCDRGGGQLLAPPLTGVRAGEHRDHLGP